MEMPKKYLAETTHDTGLGLHLSLSLSLSRSLSLYLSLSLVKDEGGLLWLAHAGLIHYNHRGERTAAANYNQAVTSSPMNVAGADVPLCP